METFRFRLNCVDHYQATPTTLDPILFPDSSLSQRKDGPKVPVIRAFGATETGQKVCAHIHGALPYLFVPYEGSPETEAVHTYMHTLRSSIDHALAVSYRRNTYDARAAFVGHITLVKGVPFYGYHVGYKYFLKIYMLNPTNMVRLADLLLQGAVMGRPFQPYESHIQYLLQWMCDFNLYGCAYIDCAKVQFRGPVPDFEDLDGKPHRWHDRTIRHEWMGREEEFPRQSHCSIEVDICVHDILNKKDIRPRPVHHDFNERFHEVPADEKYVNSMASLWKDETRRRKRRLGLVDSTSSPFSPEELVSMSADSRNEDKGGWIHEEEFQEIIDELVQKGERGDKENLVGFDEFVVPDPQEQIISTVLESTEDLFPDSLLHCYAPDTDITDSLGSMQSNAMEAAVVDEAVVADLDEHDDLYDDVENVNHENGILREEGDEPAGIDGIDFDGQDPLLHRRGRSGGPYPEADGSSSTSPRASGSSRSQSRNDNGISNPSLSGSSDPLEKNRSMMKRKGRHVYDSDSIDRFSDVAPPSKVARTGEKEVSRQRVHGGQSKSMSFSQGHNDCLRSTSKQGHEFPNLSQSSQTSVKAHGTSERSTLSFPVVKNPNDPRNALHLSQRSEPHNSQKSTKTPTPKASVSNDNTESPLTPWTEPKSASTMFSPRRMSISREAHQLAGNLSSAFNTGETTTYVLGHLPPSADVVESTMHDCGVLSVIYQDAYYSNEKDVPDRAREYAGREFKLESTTLPYLPDFDPTGSSLATYGKKPPMLVNRAKEEANYRRRKECTLRHWEIAIPPPTVSEVEDWLRKEQAQIRQKNEPNSSGGRIEGARQSRVVAEQSQIDGPTQKHQHGFKYSQKQKSTSVQHETQYMSIMSLEVHVDSRASLVPDPAEDEIGSIFWCVQSGEDHMESTPGAKEGVYVGVLTLSEEDDGIARKIARQADVEVLSEDNELDLLNRIVTIVREWDPDILTGYEVHNSSWGYLIERARVKYEFNLPEELSRMKSQSHGRFGRKSDPWGFEHTSTISITGRHMINIWRAMRSELNLLQYTMENVVFHLIHKRIPHYTFRDLTDWYTSGKPRDLAKVLDYFISRVQLNLDILEANELVPRISEQARLLGVDFFSVISRGSQFKVESLMFRIAKPENYILVSPSRKQVGQQNALECLPLVMEPQSDFYNSPLLVLDFQSLYPSVMIAYNYCYSTFLGRIASWRGQSKMGFTEYERSPGLLELVRDYVNIAPNGMMYVKPELRKSLLAKMLGEILETRVMVKGGMKVDKDDKVLQQLLNNRQLALKLMANVTYGYTSASFSGRMPCSEIADSIVQTGRETLEKAIALIHSVPRWGAEVVYGDTDSLFVYLKGRTRDQAFAIGNEIAEAITNANPRPVKLKFEKVYHPCVLLAKKRYVGFKYESPSQTIPDFDAKGIETVRRDGTPAEQKIEETALKLLFRTADLSQVKRYFQAQCGKIMRGRVSVQDFLFAREVRLGTYSERAPPPPGALIATRRMLQDRRAEPQYGERVPYVVVTGAPGARLIDRCVAPEALLRDDAVELDAEYYIAKNIIPPLERIFNLVGANVRQWYDEMPKVQRARSVAFGAGGVDGGQRQAANHGLFGAGTTTARRTLESYMRSTVCVVCRARLAPKPQSAAQPAPLPLCDGCAAKPATALLALRTRLQKKEARVIRVHEVCRSCANVGFGEDVRCDSRDCPVFYTRVRENARFASLRAGIGGVIDALENLELEKGRGLDW